MTDPLLSAFPPPLLRRVLCGGGGLPPAWGPLVDVYDGLIWSWNPSSGVAYTDDDDRARAGDVMEAPEFWTLPLDHWRPRLAACAVWMLTGDVLHASVDCCAPDWFVLSAWRGRYCTPEVWYWRADGTPGSAAIRLPTLAEHLRDHEPPVALLLALFDVPEIRAKLEARNG